MVSKETTTQKVEEQVTLLSMEDKQRKYQEMFSQMKDWGKESVYGLHKRFSIESILELLECRDIYPVNFVDGWKENSKDWNQDEYDRIKKEFFKGFFQFINSNTHSLPSKRFSYISLPRSEKQQKITSI